MRSKFKWIFTLLLAFSMQFSFAQEKTVTGTVTDASGMPLPGATVVVKGTNRGTSTDFDGKFSIKASAGETLDFSFVGYKTSSIKVGASNVVNATLADDTALDEVVVTGMAIKRDKKTLGYAVTTISNEDFASKPQTDVARALTGKAPGVNIQQTSGLSGSGTNIIIRGYSSINGSNQPLFVVDGIPFNSDTNNDGDFVAGSTNASSRFLDLDPNSIESISILKGLSATTLYGSAGRNGVILVTTKSGNTKDLRKKMEVSVATSYFANEVANLPDYQNNFGNGFYQTYAEAFSNWGPRFGTTGAQGIAADGTVPHPYADVAAFPEFASAREVYAPRNNIEPFFRTGSVLTNSINIGGRSKEVNYNFGFGQTTDNGFVENNNYKRINFSGGGSAKLTNGLTLTSSMQYVMTDRKTPPTAAGFGSNSAAGENSIFANILYTPRNIDLFNYPYQSPIDGSSVYYRADIQNPRWTLYNASDSEKVRRFFVNTTLSYELNSWSNVSYRLAYDAYNQTQTYLVNRGGPQNPNGTMNTTNRLSTTWDHTLSYNFNTTLGGESSSWKLDGVLGFNPRLERLDYNGVFSSDQFIFDLRTHDNFSEHSGSSAVISSNTIGLFGSATLGYKEYLFLNLQGRNDWYSSLQPDNRSIFYPSASVSFLPSEAFKGIKGNVVNFLKVRLGYGSSAGFPSPYSTVIGLASSTRVFNDPTLGTNVNTLGLSARLGNLNLKPELITEIELGIEGKFFNNRLGLDFSIYDKRSTDLLLTSQPIDPSTGFTVTSTNNAEVSNKGIELGLNFHLIKNEGDGFNWNVNTMFTTNRNIVESLGGGLERTPFAGFTDLGNFAVPGRPYGVIYGTARVKDANGNYVIDADGDYLVSSEVQEIGDPNADWRGTLINELSYKNFTLQWQFEYQKGGDIFSITAASLLARGLTTDTDFDRSRTFVIPGVLENGNVNNIQIPATQFYFNNTGLGGTPRELAVYDATNLRLREVSLSYTFPKSILDKTPFGSATLSFVGQNLWFKAFNFPSGLNFDPDVTSLGVGNGQGFDFLTGPTNKRYGFNLNLTF